MAPEGAARKKELNRYERILIKVFVDRFREGADEVRFSREDLVAAGEALQLDRPKNVGDLLYHFRYRAPLPDPILSKAPVGRHWVIRPAGRGRYRLHAVELPNVRPNSSLTIIDVPDATPGVIVRYAMGDEQALLARLRYNRLVDIFSGLTCYSLQNHLRTTVEDLGQLESDEVYVGIERSGTHFVLPVEAKGDSGGALSLVQVESDLIMCRVKFPEIECRPIGAQFLPEGVIAMFEFVVSERGLEVKTERHYRLVPQRKGESRMLAEFEPASDALS